MIVGYARVSSSDQDLSIQLDQLKTQGCEKIFSEKVSGSNAEDRSELHRMLDYVREGDIVIVTKTDRIARNTRDALEIADSLAAKDVGFKLLDLGDMDINGELGRVIYTVMSTFAELELKRIRRRQREGIDRALANGKKLGRPNVLTPELTKQIKQMMLKLDNQSEIARALNISRTSVRKALRA